MAHADNERNRRRKAASASGRTIEIAVNRALAELDFAPGELSEDQFQVTVVRPPEEGFLGVGGSDAVVEVRLLFDGEVCGEHSPESSDQAELEDEEESLSGYPGDDDDALPAAGSARLREFLGVILRALGVDAKIRIVEQVDSITAEVSGEDLGVFIGRRGQTIDAIEYLASVVLYPRPESRKRVEIDAEGYKQRRKVNIERVALRKAQEAVRRRRPVHLEPMTSAERKIVHMALKDRRDVVTESQGREPNRAVVITPVRPFTVR